MYTHRNMNTNLTIKTGDYQIIASGQVILLADQLSTLIIELEKVKMIFEIEFKDEEGSSAGLKFEGIEKKQKFTFINFNSSLGQGNTELVKIGTFDNGVKEVFFSFRIYTLNDKKLKTLIYTFYFK